MQLEASTNNFLGYSPAELADTWAVLRKWSVTDLIELADTSGYQGLSVQIVRSHFLDQIRSGKLSQRDKDSIIGGEQSPRNQTLFGTDRNGLIPSMVRERANLLRVVLLPAFSALFPHRVDSLDDLQKLQETVGRKLPMVVFPSEPGERDFSEYKFAKSLFKPTPEAMRQLAVRDINELLARIRINQTIGRGINGVVLNSHFIQTLCREFDMTIEKVVELLLPVTDKLEVSLGRADAPIPGFSPEIEISQFVHSNEDSPALKMLVTARDLGWDGRVGTLVPATAIRFFVNNRTLSFEQTMITGHNPITDTINGVFAKKSR